MVRGQWLFENHRQIIYRGTEPHTLVKHFKDHAIDGRGDGNAAGIGVINNRFSEFIMLGLHEIGIATHFIQRINMREQLIRKTETLPITVVVHNAAAGDFSTRFSIEEGTTLPRSIVEYFHAPEWGGEQPISEEHLTAFGLASPHDIDDIMACSLRTNDFISGVLHGAGLYLAQYACRFGRVMEEGGEFRLVIAEDISPDTALIWSAESRLETENARKVARAQIDPDSTSSDVAGVANATEAPEPEISVPESPVTPLQSAQTPANTAGDGSGKIPSGDAVNVPGTDAPGTDAPGTDAPGTDAPGTDAPGTDVPGTDAPGTDAPVRIAAPSHQDIARRLGLLRQDPGAQKDGAHGAVGQAGADSAQPRAQT